MAPPTSAARAKRQCSALVAAKEKRMATWKLTIRPDYKAGFDPFNLCRTKSLVGIGWSYIFENKTIASKQDSYNALLDAESNVPAAIKTLLDEVQVGDFIWLHKDGGFFLCKIRDSEVVLGPQIVDNFQQGTSKNSSRQVATNLTR
jgi:hypothetical protein